MPCGPVWVGPGSSPLARGAPVPAGRGLAALRLIPARAGSTPSSGTNASSRRAHPRSRGEHRHDRGRDAAGLGLIPARAGSTTPCAPRTPGTAAHPRSRGEHRRTSAAHVACGGSSPLARGARGGGVGLTGATGLIPARAGSTRNLARLSCPARAHPRSRGEHFEARAMAAAWPGSSPLARGARDALRPAGRRRGLIPARAGSTPPRWGCCRCPWAHPLSRGEHILYRDAKGRRWGSSPLARGALTPFFDVRVLMGLIPARAGSTSAPCVGCGTSGAHPRSRGEHSTFATVRVRARGSSPLARGAPPGCRAARRPAGGSSPLARGALSVVFGVLSAGRLIPARAGSTGAGSPSSRSRRAHPRSRGEHRQDLAAGFSECGSSPLARGAHLRGDRRPVDRGLIPARAGSTPSRGGADACSRAHPRSRGEHDHVSTSPTTLRGSSPLARGARPDRDPSDRFLGLIPARAGSTSPTSTRRPASRAHPRSRGEHSMLFGSGSAFSGSSPLARGAHPDPRRTPADPGLIPARAGSTASIPSRENSERAHPRSRGEHGPASYGDLVLEGSSPLARGARDGTGRGSGPAGLIPARAGSTDPVFEPGEIRQAHPRSRGEHMSRHAIK